MQSSNIQQLMTEPVWLKLLGQDGAEGPLRIGPEDLDGNFYFPIHDGTLPLDRVALLEVWKEILMAIFRAPMLATQFDTLGIFEYVAQLGGARNLGQFRVQGASNEGIAAAASAGNVVPLPQGRVA
jgi:hypothetical protein